jgi:hypothetical protein
MAEPAQAPVPADTTTVDQAAAIFKAQMFPETVGKPRDDQGRFAPVSADPPEEAGDEDESAAIAEPEEGTEDEADDAVEAADEAQPDDVPMPVSWSKDDEGLWSELPAEAKTKLVEREAQRETAVNAKFQESANARKAAETQAAEANANRDAYARAIDDVISMVQLPPEPNPQQYGLGTAEYDRDSYDLAHYQWRQAAGQVQTLTQQRQAITAQQAQEQDQARQQTVAEVEQVAFPKFVSDVPDLADPVKGQKIVSDVIQYAIKSGIPAEQLGPGSGFTSREAHILWKASEYDRMKAAGKRVAATATPKPAAPVVKPGGITPRQTVQTSRLNGAKAQLAKTGSLEDAAAVFKHLLR